MEAKFDTSVKAEMIMHKGCECAKHDMSVFEASKLMERDMIGALPVCGPDNKLMGMVTDRDMVVKCIAKGLDPKECIVKDLCEGPVVWINQNATAREVLASMEEHQIRRLPVLDDNKTLVGIITQADLAKHLGEYAVGELVTAIARRPAVQHAK